MKVILMLGPSDGEILDINPDWLPALRVPFFERVNLSYEEKELEPLYYVEPYHILIYRAGSMNTEGILEMWYEP